MPANPHTNRLIRETSPYLLQHAHNPVDWHPWGAEAFEIARRENKPIFLSVGYSTCYWCHVMERQCFENEAIAAEMNRRMVSIKVDREERPDVDQLYMTAVQLMTRQGGWPMSVFLLPDLRPFYGGTYFPPTDGHGRPGFPRLVAALEEAFRNRRNEAEASAEQLVGFLRQMARPRPAAEPVDIGMNWVAELIQRSTGDFDSVHGGFGTAPKFPRQTLLELILVYLREQSDPGLLNQLRVSLDAMAHGGIRDHLGGGFHRYSTDAQWLVPHFEIMLYDNAMLLWIYAEAYRQTRDVRYAAVARGIADFVLREMTSPEGAFFTALDAEVDAEEGGSYLWTRQQVQEALAGHGSEEEIARFLRVYGLEEGPNFADPHQGNGMLDKNVLYLAEPGEGEGSALLDARLGKLREILYATRRQRKQPMLDTKILTSWNALMIRGLAHAAGVLGEDRYRRAAATAGEYLLRHHRDGEGGLMRGGAKGLSPSPCTQGEGRGEGELELGAPSHDQNHPHPNPLPEYKERGQEGRQGAFLDDYAFLIQALLALAGADDDDKWRPRATELAALMRDRFWAADGGGFFYTDEQATDLIVRQMVASDSPLPSGNGVAAMVMLDLGESKIAAQTIAAFAGQLNDAGEGMSALVQGALLYVRTAGGLKIVPGGIAQSDPPLSRHERALKTVEIQAAWDDPSRLAITCTVQNGFHVNAHDARPPLSPTRLTVGGTAAEAVESIAYPAGRICRLALADEELSLYQGRWVIVVKFKSPPARGKKVDLGLSYQACDENACLPIVTRHLSVTAP